MRLLLVTPPLPRCIFALDRTGVGRAVSRLFSDELSHKVICTYAPITVTAGLHPAASGSLMVPRQELVGTLQVLLQTRRLQVARTLPEAVILVRELEAFRLKPPTLVATDPEAWREGEHDDLVLAVGIAAWCGEQGLPPVDEPPPPRPRRYIAV
jgi:hypothetical protein